MIIILVARPKGLMPRIYNINKYLDRRRGFRKKQTRAEIILWYYLRSRKFFGLKFRRQHSIGNYIVDFYCPKFRLVIELDGDSHFETRQQAYDRERTQWLESLHIHVIRFTNDRILHDLERVLEELKEYITSLNPSSVEEGTDFKAPS